MKPIKMHCQTGTRHESTTQAGLFFWAEAVDVTAALDEPTMWSVVSQATGYPATEAFDDWFAKKEDADDIAKKLAKGEL